MAVVRRLSLDVGHEPEGRDETKERKERWKNEPTDQEQESDRERERHPQDGADSRNQNVGRKSFEHEARTMLATGDVAHNEAIDPALRECLNDVRPVLDSRRVALVGASLFAFVSLIGLVPMHDGIAVLVAAMSGVAVLERRMVMRANSPRGVRRVLFAGAMTYCTLVVGLWFFTSDRLWLGMLALVLTLSSSASLLEGRQLAIATAYPCVLVALFFVGVAADVIRPMTLAPGNRPAYELTLLASDHPTLGAVLVAFLALIGLPMLVQHTYVSNRRLRRARDELRRASIELIGAEQVVVESREQLRRWNDQLNEEVRAKTAELEEQNRYLSAINAVSFALSGPVEHDGITSRTCELIARILGMRAAQLHVESAAAVVPDVFVTASRGDVGLSPIDASLMTQVATDGVPRFFAPHANEDPGTRSIGQGSDDVFAVVPLIAKGLPVGSFGVVGNRSDGWSDRERHLLMLVGRELGVAFDNAQLYQSAVTTAASEAALNEALELIGAGEDLTQALTTAFAAVGDEIAATLLAVVSRPEGTHHSTVLGAYAQRRELLADPGITATLMAAPGLAADRAHPLVLGKRGEGPVSRQMTERGIATLVLVPVVTVKSSTAPIPTLITGRQSLRYSTAGALVVGFPEAATPGQSCIDLLTRLAEGLARRIETDALLRLQARRIRELDGLAQIATTVQSTVDEDRLFSSFARSLAGLVDYAHLYIVQLDESGRHGEVAAYGAGGRLANVGPGWARTEAVHSWFHRRSIASWARWDEAPPDFVDPGDQQGVLVPMRPKGQVLGLVFVATRTRPGHDQETIIGQAVEQLSLALDSAALYRQATERAARIQVLGHMARIVASVADLREAFGAFSDEMRWLIPFDRAVMLLVDEDAGNVEAYATYPEEADASDRSVNLAGSIAEVAIAAGRPIALERADERYAELHWSCFGDAIQELAAVPIMNGDRCTAVFALARDTLQGYSADEFSALEEVSGLLAVTIDRLRLYEAAEHNARHDTLTGLPNLRALNERLDAMQAPLAADETAAIAMIDMDDLKMFNDTLGHEAGDRVIKIVARELRANCRAEDFVARVGGDEFVVLMQGADAEAALAAAERVHQTLWDAHAEIPAAPTRIRISVGVAVAPDDGHDPHALLHAADQAMYEAKFAGGRRTQLARDRHGSLPPHLLGQRPNRVVETVLRATTAGASESERAALAAAERYAVAVAPRLGLPGEALPPLRMLVAAAAAERLTDPRRNVDQGTALALVSGLQVEWSERAPDEGATAQQLAALVIELAWLQVAQPAGSGLGLDEALAQLRSRVGDDSAHFVEAIAEAASQGAGERRHGGQAA